MSFYFIVDEIFISKNLLYNLNNIKIKVKCLYKNLLITYKSGKNKQFLN